MLGKLGDYHIERYTEILETLKDRRRAARNGEAIELQARIDDCNKKIAAIRKDRSYSKKLGVNRDLIAPIAIVANTQLLTGAKYSQPSGHA